MTQLHLDMFPQQDSPLHVDWCSQEAAKFAVKNWHYSQKMPTGDIERLGVWEDGIFRGAVIFSRGANNYIGSPYGLKQTEIRELSRVALSEHKNFVSKILRQCIKKIKNKLPDVRLLVSYADPNKGHLGHIYQAGNWVYVGPSISSEIGYLLNNQIIHGRSVFNAYGTKRIGWLRENVDPNAKIVRGLRKLKYLYPLDRDMRHQILKLSKPYPKSIE